MVFGWHLGGLGGFLGLLWVGWFLGVFSVFWGFCEISLVFFGGFANFL